MLNNARMKTNDLAALCRRVGTGLSAGVDARKTWKREADRARSGSAGKALNHIADELAKGRSIHEAAAETGEAFPPVMHDMLRVGEQTGHGDRVLLKLADHFEHMGKLRRIFLTGIIWPMIQFGLAILVVALLIYLNESVRANTDGAMDLVGIGLEGASGAITFLIIMGVLCLGLLLVVRQWSQGKWGAKHALTVLGRVPVLGECLRTFALGRMAWTLSLTTNTAMDVKSSIQSGLASTGHPIYMSLRERVSDRIQNGAKMYESLNETKVFPVEFLDAVEVGEETGRLSESMEHLSEQYTERTRSAAKALTIFASFAVWGFVALMIAMVVIRVVASYAGFITDLSDGF